MPDCRDSIPHTTPLSIPETQRDVFSVALELLAIEACLLPIARALPEPDPRMEELEIPPDVAAHLLGTLNYVVAEYLRPAAEALLGAARATPASLEREFRELKRREAGASAPAHMDRSREARHDDA